MFGKLLTAGAITLACATTANAETFEVQMLNRGEAGAMVFEPAFVKAEVGDTITFLATDRGHNAETVEGMIPEGAAEFDSGMGKDLSVTLDQEGVYGIKCAPHYLMGMVALIQVGAPTNADEAATIKHRGKAKNQFNALFEQVEP